MPCIMNWRHVRFYPAAWLWSGLRVISLSQTHSSSPADRTLLPSGGWYGLQDASEMPSALP